MSKQEGNSLQSLQGMAQGNLSSMDALRSLIEATFKDSGLDTKTYMLVRIAALATLDAAPASWVMNMEASDEAGLTAESILGTLIAIAPVIGTARIVSAAANITKALDLAEELAQ
jgi:4-carboxymuconolactone decarboxylase